MGAGWIRDVVKRIREHPDPNLAASTIEVVWSVGEHRTLTFRFPREAEVDAARALNAVQLPPLPLRRFYWIVRWDPSRRTWTLDLPFHADASRHSYGPFDERQTAYPQEKLGATASDRT